PGDFQFMVELLEIMMHHLFWKMIMTCRNRCMGSKDCIDRNRLRRTGKIQSLTHEIKCARQHHEGGMPFITVPDRGLDTHLFQCGYASYPENDFLFDTHGLISAVKLMSNQAIMFG